MRKPERRVYLKVPFQAKDAARRLGARWDKQAHSWYVPAGADPAPFLTRWSTVAGVPSQRSGHPDAANPGDKPSAAQVLGRLGGIAGGRQGGKARAAALSPERRREIAIMGVQARQARREQRRALLALQRRDARTNPAPKPESVPAGFEADETRGPQPVIHGGKEIFEIVQAAFEADEARRLQVLTFADANVRECDYPELFGAAGAADANKAPCAVPRGRRGRS